MLSRLGKLRENAAARLATARIQSPIAEEGRFGSRFFHLGIPPEILAAYEVHASCFVKKAAKGVKYQ
jgi:hypothetical protein